MQKVRIRAAIEEIEWLSSRVKSGEENVVRLIAAKQRLNSAQLDYHSDPARIIALHEQNVAMASELETLMRERFRAGMELPDAVSRAIYFRADAELQLLRAQRDLQEADG